MDEKASTRDPAMDSSTSKPSHHQDEEKQIGFAQSSHQPRGETNRRLRIERTNSISFVPPTPRTPGMALPALYKTMSLQLDNSTLKDKSNNLKDGKKDTVDLANIEFHAITVDDLLTRLGTSATQGLDPNQISRRVAQYGPNVISPPPKNLVKKIFFYVFGGFGSLLLVASIICFLAWKPIGNPDPEAANLALAVVLLLVIVIQAVFNAWQDHVTSQVMASISNLVGAEALVLRDGTIITVAASELVPGDVVKITLGCKLPADLRLIEISSDLKFDRSILTGESDAIPATIDSTDCNFLETRNVALQGTLCTSGSGIGIVVQTGDNTVFGRIAKLSSQGTGRRTTLEAEILRFVIIIASLAIVVASLIIIVWVTWLRVKYPGFISTSALLINVVSVMVAFIPEGLPVCVTLSLTVIANAMRKKKVLCKSLATVETLGAVDVLLSDKTGTLTTGKMTVTNLAIGSDQMSASAAREFIRSADKGENQTLTTLRGLQDLASIAAICNDAQFEGQEPVNQMDIETTKVNGDATDSGLLRFAHSIQPVSHARGQWEEMAKIAFNSKNKFAMKLMKPTGDGQHPPGTHTSSVAPVDSLVIYVKGAPDVLLPRCSSFVESDGLEVTLSQNRIEGLIQSQEYFASQGERVLLLSRKVVPLNSINLQMLNDVNYLTELVSDLSVVGLLALTDPPKHDTAETVAICRRAGMRFFIVTGDFALTAAAIGKNVGVITTDKPHHLSDLARDKDLQTIPAYSAEEDAVDTMPHALVLTGSDLFQMTESQWKQTLCYREIVFARTSPQQKLQITQRFQEAGHTVAVTGDGVNDAPALKAADIGIAMGGGSEVAMDAADLVLLEDFSAIITAIEYGRMCFENLKKVCLYLLPAGSFSELMPILFNVFFGLPQALSSFQMIIICVGTDVLPALSLIHEKPESDLLLRKPRDRKKERLVDFNLLFHAYFFIGIMETLCAMTTSFYFGFVRRGIPFSTIWLSYGNVQGVTASDLQEATNRTQSIYFFCLVFMQWGNLMATRTRRLSIFQQPPILNKATQNYYLFPAMAIALIVALFFSYIPWFQNIMQTRGVGAESIFLPILFAIGILGMDEIRKFFVRRYPRGPVAKMAW